MFISGRSHLCCGATLFAVECQGRVRDSPCIHKPDHPREMPPVTVIFQQLPFITDQHRRMSTAGSNEDTVHASSPSSSSSDAIERMQHWPKVIRDYFTSQSTLNAAKELMKYPSLQHARHQEPLDNMRRASDTSFSVANRCWQDAITLLPDAFGTGTESETERLVRGLHACQTKANKNNTSLKIELSNTYRIDARQTLAMLESQAGKACAYALKAAEAFKKNAERRVSIESP